MKYVNQLLKATFVGLSLSLLFGCVSTGMTDAEKTVAYESFIEQNKLEKVRRITAFRLHGWRYLNRDYIILSSSIRKPFLVEINGPCYELSYSHTIGIHRNGSSLNEKFDWVFSPSQPDIRCRIQSIYKLDKDQADELSAIGKKIKEQDQSEESENKETQEDDSIA